ncbi:MAG: dihydrolipoyl dehydrogenase [Desulfobacteraceae bacterium]|jgi:dihydrolipoamide dehydrogenase
MKAYDLIAIGTGSAMNVVEAILQNEPGKKVAVIDKDEPGGICLTRGCIPTKILVYPAEVLRIVEGAKAVGVDAHVKRVDFMGLMKRMRVVLERDIGGIRKGLTEAKNIDYYHAVAEFTAPYQLQVGDERITSKMIFLCLGSKPLIPPLKGLDQVSYHTSDSILGIQKLPSSLAILGGGYIAAEYGHFFSAMGSKVTIVGRNPRFLPAEEPEVSELAEKEMSKHLTLMTNHEVIEVERAGKGKKTIIARDRSTGRTKEITSEEILVAVGRASNADILHPERGGVKTDEKGWILANQYLETSQRNVWAFGDAIGKHLFKHVANYESRIVYYNAVLGQRVKMNYQAVPHAVFTHPEIASVGLRQKEAIEAHGEEGILVGFQRYQNTAKGEAMGVKDYFVKVIVENGTNRVLGAHIIGPQASLLIQEIITVMYTADQSMTPVIAGMHIHPALSEAVERAFIELMPPRQYNHMFKEGRL